MAENSKVFEFLSKCWVPSVGSEHRIYYACGNTRMHDFLKDIKVSREVDVLVLGIGDVRHVMKTVAGLSLRPPSSAGEVKEIRFHLNDVDQDVIARDVILLEIMNKLDPESKSDAEFLWSVWYNAFMVKKDFIRLKALLEDLVDKYSNLSRESEQVCKFGDKQYLKSILETWNCWLNRKHNQSAVKRNRLKSFEDVGYTMSLSNDNIAMYAAMQIYTDRGIKESDVETVGKEMTAAAIDGFVNFSEEKGRNDFANPTLMRPGSEEWLVEHGAHAAACYLPLQKEFSEQYTTVHEACFAKMRETISSYLKSWNATKVTYTFWATDLFHLCHWLLPSDTTFDFIFTSNLMDHVGLWNLLVTTQPRLRNSQSVLLTESYKWNVNYRTLEEFFDRDLRCNYMLLPSIIGLKLAEDLDLGSSNLQGFYRTMYGRHSEIETIYWTKSLIQNNVQINLKESLDMQQVILFLLVSTFWNKPMLSASSVRQTPLTLMYFFQRLQHHVSDGMTTLLECVEMVLSDRAADFSCNKITWDVVCWAFGLKPRRDRLCVVNIPFKEVNSHLPPMLRKVKVSCRLKLDCNTSSNLDGQVLSLFQYDPVRQEFQVPILESAWKVLPMDATLSIIDSHDEMQMSVLHELRDRKVQVKREGEIKATYDQPTVPDLSITNSVQCLICCEDAEKYQLPQVLGGAETKMLLDFLCQPIVSMCYNSTGVESTAMTKMPYKFSCAVDSYDVKNIDYDHIQTILYKQKTWNTGRTAMPFRLIDDSMLLPFANGQDIKTYLADSMICELMFCSPNDIESRARALSGQYLSTEDSFVILRLVIEHLWQLGSKKDKILNHTLRLKELPANRQTAARDILVLEIEGYYMYEGLPFIKLKFTEVDKTPAPAVAPSDETLRKDAVMTVKDRRSLQLLTKMLYTNSSRMSQERSACQHMTAHTRSLNSFLQMVFRRSNGEDMIKALHDYPSNSISVNQYIERIYSASIRKNFVVPSRSAKIMKEKLSERMESLAAATKVQTDKKPNPMKAENTSLDLKQEFCSECKKSTADLQKCSRCKLVAYCSKECQKKDWPEHKKNCSAAKPKVETVLSKKSKNKDSFIRKLNATDIKKNSDACYSTQEISQDEDGSSNNKNNENGSTEEKDFNWPSAASVQSHEIANKVQNDEITENVCASMSVEVCLCCRQGKANMKKCTKCKSATYCSQECQRADWKRHRLECQALQLEGATPLMNRCKSCRVLGTEMKKCSRCKSVCYCSLECQRKDWNSHKATCRQP